MTQHLAISMSVAATSGPSTGRADVLEAEITHDPLRTPQIIVRATLPFAAAGLLDDKSREPANLYLAARTYNAGTLRDFDAAGAPATLGELDWSDHASTPAPLDGASLDYTEQHYTLRLFCTAKISTPDAGGVQVTLASADYILEHLANAGPEWKPAKAADGYYRLKSSLRQLLVYLQLPLEVPYGEAGDVRIPEADMKPWMPGQTARAWLDELRAAHGAVWMLSAVNGTMEPVSDPGVPAPSMSAHALSRSIESGTDLSSITGFARWADGYLIIWRWTDDAGTEHVVRDFASVDDKGWWRCRKINVEEFDRPPTGLTASARLARSQRYDIQTTWEVPMASLPEPYLDLATWVEMRGRLSSLTYRYPAAVVHGTQIKE